MTRENFIVEVGTCQMNKKDNEVCGDTVLYRKEKSENRYVAVLCDGLGSGIKANVLSTLTASMALNFRINNESIIDSARWIMDTLPTDEIRTISYCTFTIIDIDFEGLATVIEYGNPVYFIVRDLQVVIPQKKELVVHQGGQQKKLLISEFKFLENDRLISITDGVTQSGIGVPEMPFGWGLDKLHDFTVEAIGNDPNLSANEMARQIINKAYRNDGNMLKDDASCIVFYRRSPRKLLICTGPPYVKEKDRLMAEILNDFAGIKIVCGGTTAKIIARELKKEIQVESLETGSKFFPPTSKISGMDLVTEGILTLSMVDEIIKNGRKTSSHSNDPAQKIVNHLLEADIIYFLVGACINIAHQDPEFPVELDIRRNVVKRIASSLENKLFKQIKIQYI